MKYVCAAVVLVVAPALAVAQTATDASPSNATFRAAVDMVALTVTVTDTDQHPVSGLNTSHFVVLEDGVEQPLSFVAASEVPLDLTLLVDASASMTDKMGLAREAVRGLARALRPDDRVSVVEFRDGLVQRQAMTSDRRLVDVALDRMTPEGGTALYTALYVALSGLRPPAAGHPDVRRQCIVVLSDGEDTSSLVGFEDVLEKARRRGVTVYAVALRSGAALVIARNRPDRLKALEEADFMMRSLARETGGQAFFPSSAEELGGIYAAISTELGQQYAIGYTPRNTARDGAWRRVLVRVPSHPRARLRTRTGYFAEPPRIVYAAGRAGAQ